MILTLIGAIVILTGGVIYITHTWHNFYQINVDIPFCIPTSREVDFISFQDYNPHYHWIDLHRDVLKSYPDGFVALHSEKGVIVFDTDILGFTEKMNSIQQEQRSALMILHTSMLNNSR